MRLVNDTDADNGSDLDYWHAQIDGDAAAAWLECKPRTLQEYRSKGGGPRYSRLSAKMIRYTRADLRAWRESRIRHSTAEVEA